MEEFLNDMLTEKDAQWQTVKEVVYPVIEGSKDTPGVSEINWIIQVVDSSDINASVIPVLVYLLQSEHCLCIPNGQAFIFIGLLNSVTDTHQLALLLGHEIAMQYFSVLQKSSLVDLLDLSMIFLTMIWAICS